MYKEILYEGCSENCEISNFGFFYITVFQFRQYWKNKPVKVSYDMSSENTHQIKFLVFMYIPWEYQSC